MNIEELGEKVRAYYEPRLAATDDCYEAVGYPSPEIARTRHAIICELGEFSSASVLEVGCGIGNVLTYMKEKGFDGEYTGIDLMPEMIAQARQRHPEARFIEGDLLQMKNGEAADYVIASGVYQHASKDLFHRSIAAMFQRCKVAAAFNMFSLWCPAESRNEYLFADPLETMEFCRQFTSHLILRHEYMPHDFTIYMYR
jgi:trans-aconitate methyltransferase